MSIRRALLTVAVLAAIGCRSKADRPEPAPAPSASVVIGRNPDDGWGGDVEIPARITALGPHELTVRASANVEGKPIELEARFEEPTQGMMGYVDLHPVGAGGDALLAALAKAWKQPVPSKPMRGIRASAAWISGDAHTAAKIAVHTKIFFEDAELYVNWNPQTSMLELFEKDEEYRAAVLAELTAR